MGHGVGGRTKASTVQLDTTTAKTVAATFGALATPSRLQILTRLRRGHCTVSELATAVGMEQSAVSHQLRLLRNLGLVDGNRDGRSIVYSLYDNHVAELLDQAIFHAEHHRLGYPDRAVIAGALGEASGEVVG
ncbi:MAG: metalloregulator ArsR/SmtB family transcription factor [Actinomycetota bacterium]|nr:metalloregulator ArsR/SmtB family transcription factor [Actinomycetota bacterium]